MQCVQCFPDHAHGQRGLHSLTHLLFELLQGYASWASFVALALTLGALSLSFDWRPSPPAESTSFYQVQPKTSYSVSSSPGPRPWEPDVSRQPSFGDIVVITASNPVKKDDLSWLQRQPYPYAIMTKADPAGGIHNLEHNYGTEATSYLHFILAHWDHLPERMVFTHGHWHSWHARVRCAPSVAAVMSLSGDHSSLPLQPQDYVVRNFNPYAYNFTGLSSSWTDFRRETGNQEYLRQLRVLRNITTLGKYLDEPDGVPPACLTTHYCFTAL